LAICALLAACGGNQAQAVEEAVPTAESLPATAVTPPPVQTSAPTIATTVAANQVPAYGYQIVNTFPHDTGAYTQGLQFVDGQFYESTGRHGTSSLRRVEIETGAILQQHDVAEEYFAEGLSVVGDRIYQLTWQEGIAFLYDRNTFEELDQFDVDTEGWGLTYDSNRLIMSDGSDTLYFRDPQTFEETGRIAVRYLGQPLTRLNELEYIDGEVWANVYQSEYIVRINPDTGDVTGLVDLRGLLQQVPVTEPVDVLNGIAWDADNDRLFVTGKWWPAVFEITVEQVGWAS
jgi:glutamine cyclotransferase